MTGDASELTPLCGWGRFPVVPARLERARDLVAESVDAELSRGLGRAYGDAALPARPGGRVLSTVAADRILRFDEDSGVLHAEAGLSLSTLHQQSATVGHCATAGHYAPVVPGTQRVTLGGMVAADVHGKNHHVAGTIGAHLRQLTLRVGDGRVVDCSPEIEPELFHATVGGMGLTGHLLAAELTLQPVPSRVIVQETEGFERFDELLQALREAATEWPFTVAWADLLSRGQPGRGVLSRGRWARADEVPERPPAAPRPRVFPGARWLLADATARAFNALYFRRRRAPRRQCLAAASFFYPLDAVRRWNRFYGPRGFIQHQCVLPASDDLSLYREFLDLLVAAGASCYLCVIKDCGAEGSGWLSFPRPGMSFALDLPQRGEATQRWVDRINEFVIAAGGRIYLAKDALTRAEHFAAMEPRLPRWLELRRRWDPEGRIRSALSVRLFGDTP